MRIGIISDTHDEFARTKTAVTELRARKIGVLIHCGDIFSEKILELCSPFQFYFVFGNHDSDMVRLLKEKALTLPNATCLELGGEIQLAGKRIAVVHGHLTSDLRPLLTAKPDYLLSGHVHQCRDWMEGTTRRIVPGALHRADEYHFAVLDLESDELTFVKVPE